MRYFSIFAVTFMIVTAFPLIAMGQGSGFGGGLRGPVEITAQQVEHDRANNTYTARGQVEMKDETRNLKADYVFYDDNTRDVIAEGNVVFEGEGDRIECDRMVMNLETKKGTLENARLYIREDNVFITGGEIEKTGEAQYRIKKGEITTCGWDRPEWKFTSDHVDITVEGYAKTKATKFHILDIPVFYLPWGIFPVKSQRQSGFLIPEFALSSRDGTVFKMSYFWAIAKDKDATISAEYIGDRGVNVGTQFRYALREDLKGQWDAAIIDDRKFNHTRYQIKGTHEQVFFNDLRLKANVWHVFDNDYLKDFGEDVQERSESQLKSNIFVEKPLKKSLLTAEMAHFRNLLTKDNDATFQLYPQITYFTEYVPLFGGKMYLDLDTTLTNFHRDKGDTYTRLGVDPSLRLPHSFKGINTLLSATLHETAYLINRSDTIRDDSKYRQTFTLEGDMNMQFLRAYHPGLSWFESAQSLIKPNVRYTFIPNTSSRHLPNIDAYDRIYQTNAITYSINHYLFDTSGEEGARREMSLLEISQTYGLSGKLKPSPLYEGSGSRFSDIDVRFTLSPIPHLGISHQSVISTSGEGARTIRNGLSYNVPGKYYGVISHNYNSNLNNDIYLDIGGFYKVFEGSYQMRYTFKEAEWIDARYRLTYRPGCWSTSLTLTQSKRPRDTSIKISFGLTGITSRQ